MDYVHCLGLRMAMVDIGARVRESSGYEIGNVVPVATLDSGLRFPSERRARALLHIQTCICSTSRWRLK